jgi:hypothetical protein
MVLVPLQFFLEFLLFLWRSLVYTLLNGVEGKDILERLGHSDTIHFELPLISKLK